jgi:hypothetical protein
VSGPEVDLGHVAAGPAVPTHRLEVVYHRHLVHETIPRFGPVPQLAPGLDGPSHVSHRSISV